MVDGGAKKSYRNCKEKRGQENAEQKHTVYVWGAEKSVPAERAKTVRENLVTLVVNGFPRCKECM